MQKQKQVVNFALMHAHESVLDLDGAVGATHVPNTPHGCEDFLKSAKHMFQFSVDDFMDPVVCDVDLGELLVFSQEISQQFCDAALNKELVMAQALEGAINGLEDAKNSYMQAYDLLNAHLLPEVENPLPMSEAWGAHNSCAQQLVIDRIFASSESWSLQTVCDSLLPLWASHSVLKPLCEKLVQKYAIHFRQSAEQSDIDQCSLLMLAMKKHTQLKVLHLKILNNIKVGEFLDHDFSRDEWRVKAKKNAFVLLSHHRYHLAAAFLLLAGEPEEASSIFMTRWKCPVLAVLIIRLYMNESDESLFRNLLKELIRDEQQGEFPSEDAIQMYQALLGDHQVVESNQSVQCSKSESMGSCSPDGGYTTFYGLKGPNLSSEKMYGYMHRGFFFLALQVITPPHHPAS